MKVIVTSEAAEDIAAADEWWREHRADAPRSIAIDVAEALEALSLVGPTTPVFRRIGSAAEIRRVQVVGSARDEAAASRMHPRGAHLHVRVGAVQRADATTPCLMDRHASARTSRSR